MLYFDTDADDGTDSTGATFTDTHCRVLYYGLDSRKLNQGTWLMPFPQYKLWEEKG